MGDRSEPTLSLWVGWKPPSRYSRFWSTRIKTLNHHWHNTTLHCSLQQEQHCSKLAGCTRWRSQFCLLNIYIGRIAPAPVLCTWSHLDGTKAEQACASTIAVLRGFKGMVDSSFWFNASFSSCVTAQSQPKYVRVPFRLPTMEFKCKHQWKPLTVF